MLNLEQIRSRNALNFSHSPKGQVRGMAGGEVVKKIPPLILNNGLLAALALGFDQTGKGQLRNEGHRNLFDAIANHLSDPNIALLPSDCTDSDGMARFLTSDKADSQVLKLCTAEAMAWLNYARRYVNKSSNSHKQ